jgi:hypothetical protein
MKFARSDALSRPHVLVNHVKLRARARAIAIRLAPRSRALAVSREFRISCGDARD